MAKTRRHIDGALALIIGILVIGGSLIFASAAFGLLARGAPSVTSIVFNHLALGIGIGFIALVCASILDYRLWRRFAPYLFLASLIATALVFVPNLGIEHGGGRRWIVLFHLSFQPSEALKLGVIIMCAAYFSAIRNKTETFSWGMGGYLFILFFPALILIAEPDIGTLGVIVFSSLAIFFAAGARIRDICIVGLIAILAIGVLTFTRPYVRDRMTTFLHPSQGELKEGYQIRQSLIAIGSGKIVGRGFGQSIQKFTYLPEPMGDSIFAVAAEELGFIGATVLVVLFTSLSLRGFAIASRIGDSFGRLMAIGISSYFGIEAFINIASMLGLAPLTGIPLTFISQGGSAMLVSLLSAGILLNISRCKGVKRP